MDTKQVLKTAGKVALTIASPLIGAMTWVDKKNRVSAFLGGALASSTLGTGYDLYLELHANQIYDNPKVISRNFLDASPRRIMELIISPLLFCFDRQIGTKVLIDVGSPSQKNYSISGDSVISLNRQTGRYEVNFTDDSLFNTNDKLQLASSVSQARNSLDEALKQGDIVSSRKLVEDYTAKMGGYAETKLVLEDIVSKMNQELDEQRSKLTEKVK